MSAVDAFWESCRCRQSCPIAPPPHPTFDIDAVIQAALREDDADLGDVTSLATIPEAAEASAAFLCKADGTIAGLAIADAVFAACDPAIRITWQCKDGDQLEQGQRFGTVHGNARAILRAERVALNFMQRMSGIATATAAMVTASAGTKAKVLDTRKTVAGLRLLDKWAVMIGGGCNHRMGLHDMVMIKDNHIAAAGSLYTAVQQACRFAAQLDRHVDIEVEVRTDEELRQLLEGLDAGECDGVTRVMLDNMAIRDSSKAGGVDVTQLSRAVETVGGRLETEASGNVTIDTVQAIASSGCDFISCGALTHSVKALDISFNVEVEVQHA